MKKRHPVWFFVAPLLAVAWLVASVGLAADQTGVERSVVVVEEEVESLEEELLFDDLLELDGLLQALCLPEHPTLSRAPARAFSVTLSAHHQPTGWQMPFRI